MADNIDILRKQIAELRNAAISPIQKGTEIDRLQRQLSEEEARSRSSSSLSTAARSLSSMPVPLTDEQLRASPIPVSGTISIDGGVVSTVNSTTSILIAAATFTGTGEDVSNYPSVVVAAKTDQAGTLYIEFSPDNTNWDSSLSFVVSAGINEVHRITVTRKYFRVRFTNGAVNQGYFRMQSLLGAQPALTSALNSSVQSDADSLVTRSVLMGETDSGNFQFVPVTNEGHLEVAIHDPILPFGALNTESLIPIFQSDAVYGINSSEVLATVGHSTGGVSTGTNTGTSNLFKCSTGTTALSFATMQSRKRLRYRAGQGVVGRFAGYFSNPVADCILVAGFGTGESGYYFGYNGTAFGILHSTGGVREIQTLTVSVGSGGAESVTVKLNGIDTIVAVVSGSTTSVAYQLSQATYVGWDAEQVGATVRFLAQSVGNKAGTFSLASTGTTTGTFAETLAGVASTDTWYAQTAWNGDVCDGSNSTSNKSGYNLDPSKGNVFQIDITYLGFGPIVFRIVTTSTGNNPTYTTVHSINFPNTRTATTLSQPSFPFTMAAYSAGSTTDASVSIGSFAGFVAGEKKLTGPRMTYSANSTAVTATPYRALLTVRNDRVYALRANQSVINLLSFGGAIEDTTPVTVLLIRNAILGGTPNFQAWSPSSSTFVDTAATTCTFTNNEQIIFSLPIGAGASSIFNFEDDVTLQPGEMVTIAAVTVTGTAQYVLATLNTREDQ